MIQVCLTVSISNPVVVIDSLDQLNIRYHKNCNYWKNVF